MIVCSMQRMVSCEALEIFTKCHHACISCAFCFNLKFQESPMWSFAVKNRDWRFQVQSLCHLWLNLLRLCLFVAWNLKTLQLSCGSFLKFFGNVFIENSISDFKIRVMINDIPGMLIKWLGIGGLETFLWVSDLLWLVSFIPVIPLITNVYHPNLNFTTISDFSAAAWNIQFMMWFYIEKIESISCNSMFCVVYSWICWYSSGCL